MKISIITPAFNPGKFFERTFESLKKQNDIDGTFEWIIIDDNSSENLSDKIKKFKEEANFEIVYKKNDKNIGAAASRNKALDIAKGELIVFLDADDFLSPNYLFSNYELYENGKKIISNEVWLSDLATEQMHPLSKKYIDVKESSTNKFGMFHFAGLVYARELAPNLRFDNNFVIGEDSLFATTLMNHAKKVFFNHESKYSYVRFASKPSVVTQLTHKKENIMSIIELVDGINGDWNLAVNALYRVYCSYGLSPEPEIIISELLELRKATQKLLAFFTFEELREITSKWYKGEQLQELYLFAFGDELQNTKLMINLFDNYTPNCTIFEYSETGESLTISFWLSPIFNDISIFAKTEDDKIYATFNGLRTSTGIPIIGLEHLPTKDRRYDLKLAKTEVKFDLYIEFHGKEIKIQNIKYHTNGPKLKQINGLVRTKNFDTYKSDKTFCVKNKFLYRRLKFNMISPKKKLVIRAAIWMYKKLPGKDTIIFTDRLDKADDNAEAFANFCRTQKASSKTKMMFLISKDSQDYDRISASYKTIQVGTIKHCLAMFRCKMIITSHTDLHVIRPKYKMNFMPSYYDFLDFELVMLQHGVTRTSATYLYRKEDRQIDYFVISSSVEEGTLVSDKNLGYSSSNFIRTGMPRHDLLSSEIEEKEIVYMPTWRTTLTLTDKNNNRIKNDEFDKTEYFQKIQSLLNNQNLIDFLEKNGFKFRFIPHPNIAYNIEFFTTTSKNITIEKAQDIRYSEVINRAKLFITDSSSAAFEAAYVRKPLLYYIFDEDFTQTHNTYKEYTKEQFMDNFKKVALGDLCVEEDKLVKEIVNLSSNDFKTTEKYLARMDKFYLFSDKNNSKRVYDIIFKEKKWNK